MTAPVARPETLVTDHDEDLLGYGGHAVFDETRTYRYLLTRRWADGPAAVFIMLNGSKADAFRSDPTCTRCISFARREGCGGLRILNLYGLQATDPRELRRHPDPIGPCNDRIIDEQARGHVTIAAWGADPMACERGREVGRRLTAAGVALSCLGVTKDGYPRHPLYVRSDAPLIPWEAA